MNFALMNKLKGIFGADKALEMAEKNPTATALGDFETELSAHVVEMGTQISDLTTKLSAADKGKADAEAKVVALEAQLKEAGKVPPVVLGGGDAPVPPAKKDGKVVPPADLSGPALAEFHWNNDPALKAEFGDNQKDAFLAWAESVNYKF